MINYTIKYTKIDSGYMDQMVDWPEVITGGKNLELCLKTHFMKWFLHTRILVKKSRLEML